MSKKSSRELHIPFLAIDIVGVTYLKNAVQLNIPTKEEDYIFKRFYTMERALKEIGEMTPEFIDTHSITFVIEDELTEEEREEGLKE